MDHSQTKVEITPVELKQKLDKGEDVVILDIREPHELGICRLNNTAHVPMGELAARLDELGKFKDKEVVIYCRSGGRSALCVEFLRQNGFKRVLNLAGGILLWADTVDPTVAKY